MVCSDLPGSDVPSPSALFLCDSTGHMKLQIPLEVPLGSKELHRALDELARISQGDLRGPVPEGQLPELNEDVKALLGSVVQGKLFLW